MNIINFIDDGMYELITKLTSSTMTNVMMLISYLGSAITLIILTVAAFFLIKERKYPILISLNLTSSFLLNRLLKFIFRRDRPPLLGLVKESGYSFPSGHAMVSISFYGLLIYFAYKKIKNKKIKSLTITLLSILILSIGISRIYLGVHYTTDVLGGFILGGVYLLIFIKYIIKRKEN